ncbi:hypothetical protein MTP99_008447 [Tenebrio molitor]|jgi:hypothetical protein|nr:hypothetical protein MTP99_008447 [Tenebrio molitor]
MEKDLRTANGPIRHLEFLRNFNKSFRTFKALNQQLAQKVYKCVNMFLEQVVFCAKKAVDDRQKEQLKILKRLKKELQRPQINPSGD